MQDDLRLIGLDLGSDACRVAIVGEDGPTLLSVAAGDRELPSAVAFAGSAPASGPLTVAGGTLVGAAARQRVLDAPGSGVLGVKRFLGRRADEPEARRAGGSLAHLVAAPTGDAALEVAGRTFSPPELLAPLLAAVRVSAEEQLGGPVAAVVAVPPSFGHAARQALRDAAFLAGLELVRLLDDGVAALLGVGQRVRTPGQVAICDLGAAHFGVSIVAVEPAALHVLAVAGEVVGGDDFDHRIAARLGGHDVDPSDPRLLDEVQRLRHLAMEAGQAQFGTDRDPRPVRRAELESWTRDLVDRLEDPCRAALAGSGLRPGTLDEVILVGGAARMPAVVRKLEQVFGQPITRPADADEVVALGAAAYTSLLAGGLDTPLAVEAAARTLALRGPDGRLAPLIARGTPLPAQAERLISTIRDGQQDVGLDLYEEDSPGAAPRRLGRYVVGNLPERPAGQAFVWVDVRVDVDGLVGVLARPLGASAAVPIRVIPAVGLSRAELRRLVTAR